MSFMKIALIGNPNVGKSVLFGHLTGRYATVSNYPGTTVEISEGRRDQHHIIDTPGANSLFPLSEDERVTRDILLEGKVDGILQIADMKNLRRALLLSLQIAEAGIPFGLVLNMSDEAASRGIHVDRKKLRDGLGVPVVTTVAIQGKGIRELRQMVDCLQTSPVTVTYPKEIEKAVQEISPLLPDGPLSRRFLSLTMLGGDTSLRHWMNRHLAPEVIQRIETLCREVAQKFSEPLNSLMDRRRLRRVDRILVGLFQKEQGQKGGFLERLGRLSMHPFWGIPILLVMLFLLYEFVGKFGAQTAVGWMEEGLFGRYLNPFARWGVERLFFFSPLIRDLLVGPYGVITMALTYALAIVFPIVVTFFLFFSFIDPSGYLPRLAIMSNRLFRLIGLNGKAVIPMVLGLGCDTMATLSARMMETKKQRVILTLLLALGVPCSAQLGIILGMLALLPGWMTFLWLGVILGVLMTVGFLASKILPGESAEFLTEVPPLRRPTFSNLFNKTAARLEWYLKEVIPLFILGTLVLFVLDRLHWLRVIEKASEPLVTGFLNLPPQAAEAFLIGFLRRDYGATHFFEMYRMGQLDSIQAIVSLIVMTLFVPCLANVLMIVKERGGRTALAMVGFIYPFSFLVGGVVNFLLRTL